MNQLKVGLSRLDVTPPLGIRLMGNNNIRRAENMLDPLEVSVMALSCGEDTVLLISMDALYPYEHEHIRKTLSEKFGIPQDAIFVHGTHIHTGPLIDRFFGTEKSSAAVLSSAAGQAPAEDVATISTYTDFFLRKVTDAADCALRDLTAAKMGWAVAQAPGIAFIRRFRMKDGSIATNPGMGNPDVAEPLGDVDERVNVLRFDREDGKTYVLANFGCHPDTTNRLNITADWPGIFRRTVEKTLDNVKCIFFTGAQGDVNHLDVKHGHEYGWDGYDYRNAIHLGHAVAGAVLQVFHKVRYVDTTSLRFVQEDIQIPTNRATPEQLPEAHRIMDIYNTQGIRALPLSGSARAAIVAEARRMVSLENGPDFYPVRISAVAIGNVAMVGLPCEPFTSLGLALKQAPGWDLVLPCCLTNGHWGYVGLTENYNEGAYETRGSRLKSGCGEMMIDAGLRLLGQLR